MPNHFYTVVCDYAGGTYVSQFEGSDAEDVARQWAAMISSQRPIPRNSAFIAKRVVRDLEIGLTPTALLGLKHVWQTNGWVGQSSYSATIVRTS